MFWSTLQWWWGRIIRWTKPQRAGGCDLASQMNINTQARATPRAAPAPGAGAYAAFGGGGHTNAASAQAMGVAASGYVLVGERPDPYVPHCHLCRRVPRRWARRWAWRCRPTAAAWPKQCRRAATRCRRSGYFLVIKRPDPYVPRHRYRRAATRCRRRPTSRSRRTTTPFNNSNSSSSSTTSSRIEDRRAGGETV